MADEPKVIVVRFTGLVSTDSDDIEDKAKKPKTSLSTGFKGLQWALHPVRQALDKAESINEGVSFISWVAKRQLSSLPTIANYSVSRYFRMSEDYRTENYMNNIMGNINRAKSIGESVLGGAMVGAKFGPVVSAAGAVIGGASTAFNQYINYQNQIASYERSLNATRVETAFKAQRAGLYDGGKGTEN